MPASVTPLRPHRDQPEPAADRSERSRSRRGFGNIRKLPSTRYQASYLGPDGKRHPAPTTFESKLDAGAWLSMRQAEITAHRWKPPLPSGTKLTVAEYAERWMASRELKPRTRADYRALLTNKILPTLGGQPLGAVTPTAVRAWYSNLDPAKPTIRAHAYGLLRTIYSTAVTDEYVATNPCRISGAGSVKRKKAIRPASLDELTTLVAAAPEKYQVLLLLAAWCALRFGELTELRRGDVDLAAQVIRVRRGVTWVDGEPVVGTPKSHAGSRDVSIPPHLVPVLRAHLEVHAQPGKGGLLFPNGSGGHLRYSTLTKVFYKARSAAGREDLRLHELRHTGAVLAALAGSTLAELMERLGHTSPNMALRYQHVAEGRSATIAAKMSAMVI